MFDTFFFFILVWLISFYIGLVFLIVLELFISSTDMCPYIFAIAVPYSFSDNRCGVSLLNKLLTFWLIHVYSFTIRKYSPTPFSLSIFIKNKC